MRCIKIKGVINANISTVYNTITNNKDYQWRSDIKKLLYVDEKFDEEHTKIIFAKFGNIINHLMRILSYVIMNTKNMQKQYIENFKKSVVKNFELYRMEY